MNMTPVSLLPSCKGLGCKPRPPRYANTQIVTQMQSTTLRHRASAAAAPGWNPTSVLMVCAVAAVVTHVVDVNINFESSFDVKDALSRAHRQPDNNNNLGTSCCC